MRNLSPMKFLLLLGLIIVLTMAAITPRTAWDNCTAVKSMADCSVFATPTGGTP